MAARVVLVVVREVYVAVGETRRWMVGAWEGEARMVRRMVVGVVGEGEGGGVGEGTLWWLGLRGGRSYKIVGGEIGGMSWVESWNAME